MMMKATFMLLAFGFFSTEASADACDICSGVNSGSQVVIYNNLGETVDILTNAGMFGVCRWDDTMVPPCLRGLAPGASATVTLESHFGWPAEDNWGYNFATANPGTLFEITPGNAEPLDYYDISYNAGYNIPMTVVAADGATHVATSIDSPDAYPAGADTCSQVQPCASAAYASGQGTHHVYLGNRAGDVNTPGPCGCAPCPGFDCRGNESDQYCTTSGSDLWCWQNAPGAPLCPICGSSCPTTC